MQFKCLPRMGVKSLFSLLGYVYRASKQSPVPKIFKFSEIPGSETIYRAKINCDVIFSCYMTLKDIGLENILISLSYDKLKPYCHSNIVYNLKLLDKMFLLESS